MSAKQNGEGAERLHRQGDLEMVELTLFLRGPRLDAGIAAGKLFNSPGCIDKLLLASEKRVTGRADANLDVAPRGPGSITGAAGAADYRLHVLGVNICFHGQKRELDSSGLHSNGK